MDYHRPPAVDNSKMNAFERYLVNEWQSLHPYYNQFVLESSGVDAARLSSMVGPYEFDFLFQSSSLLVLSAFLRFFTAVIS